MSRRFLALIVAPLFLPFIPATAQSTSPPPAAQPSFELRGRILDTASAPLPRASVSLRAKGSDVTVAGAIAGPDGSFRVTGLRPGTFTIRVVYVGYAPVIQDITLTAATPVLDLGDARLAPMQVRLDTISVKEQRAAMTTEPDRNVYHAKDIAPGAANASELLENVPAVQVDMDGKVSLRGNENVVIQIDGRPVPIRGAQLASYLKTLTAAVIDRIEVIPNPSAKYDPEGMAGIINVALKSNVDLGLSGAFNGAYSTVDRYNTSANIGYQNGPWTTSFNGGIVSGKRTAVGINDRERYNDANALLSTTAQDIVLTPSSTGQNFSATVDYKLSARDVLSNALMINNRSSGETSINTQSLLNGSGNAVDQFVRPRDLETKGFMFDYDLALKRTFAPRTNELSTEFRFNRAHDEDVNDERRLAPGSAYTDGRIDRNDALTQQLTGQVDYVKAFKPRTKLETGWKSTGRWLDRDHDVTTDITGNGTWETSPESNDLGFDETVHALYAVVSQGVKKWDLQAGLRGEYADRTFSLGTQQFPFDYTSLFPSAIASYNVNQATQLKASYSRRIRRPGVQELNPFPSYFDADNVFFGNPDLSPEYTNAFEFGLTKNGSKGSLQLLPFYRRTSDIIRIDINTTDTLDNREITSISFSNLATGNSWGSDFVGQLRLSPRFSAITNFSVFKMVTDGGSLSAVTSDAIGWTGRINITSDLTSLFTVQAAYNYTAPMKIERGEMGAQQSANIMFRVKTQGDKGAVTLRINDPFEMVRFHVQAGDDKVLQLTERNPQSRMYFLGYQYNFGRPPRVRQVAPTSTGGGSVGFGGPPP